MHKTLQLIATLYFAGSVDDLDWLLDCLAWLAVLAPELAMKAMPALLQYYNTERGVDPAILEVLSLTAGSPAMSASSMYGTRKVMIEWCTERLQPYKSLQTVWQQRELRLAAAVLVALQNLNPEAFQQVQASGTLTSWRREVLAGGYLPQPVLYALAAWAVEHAGVGMLSH